MNIISELRSRDLIADESHTELESKIQSGMAFYCGFDPTAPSLQLGNLIPLTVSMRLAQAGLKAHILFGGATGCIGDPSGKSEERKLLPREIIEENVAKQSKQARMLFERVGAELSILNNYDWTRSLSLLAFLRDVGKYFTVNWMLGKEVVKSRLEASGISYTEFSYMLLQAMDFYYLHENHQCMLQIGGSDQWGNLTAGLELLRKKGGKEAYAFSIPLLLNQAGKKFGKSEGGAIWLDPELTSPYQLHQFLLNSSDEEVPRLLQKLTFFSLPEIAEILQASAAAPEKRIAQSALADAILSLVHGKEQLPLVKKSAAVLFGGSMEGMSESELATIFAEVPSSTLPRDRVQSQLLLDLFVETGLCPSRGEAKRLIQSGGAYVQNIRIEKLDAPVKEALSPEQSLLVLRSGKKKYHLVRLA